MVTVPNSLSMNAVKFQKAKSAPLAIKKNISPKPVQVNKKTIDEGTMRKMLTEAEQSGVDKTEIIQGLLDRGYDIEEPKTFMQKVGQVGKDIAGGTLAGFSKLPTNIVGGTIKGLGSIPIAPGMGLPKTPLQTKLQTVGSDIIKSGEQTATQNIAITGARPGAIGTQAGEMVAPLATAIVGGAATGLTKAGAGALGTVGRGIAQRSTPTIAKGLAQGALVGAGEQAIYDVAAQGKTTPESLAFGATAGGVVTGLPLVKEAGKQIIRPIKGLQKTIPGKLLSSAEESVSQALAPTKKKMKQLTERISPEFLKKGIWGSKESIQKLAKENVEKFGTKIDEAIESGVLDNVTIPRGEIEKILHEAKLTTMVGNKVVNDTKYKVVAGLQDMVSQFPEAIQGREARALRQILDEVVYATKGGIGAEDLTYKNGLVKAMADTLRSEISKAAPDLASLNKEFSFYRTLEQILDETITRQKPQSGMLRKGAAALFGGQQEGIANKIMGYIGSKVFLDATSSATWNTVSAQLKYKLAKAIAMGDPYAVNTVVRQIATQHNVILPEMKALPAPTATPIPPEGLPQGVNPIQPLSRTRQILETGMENIKQPQTVTPGKPLESVYGLKEGSFKGKPPKEVNQMKIEADFPYMKPLAKTMPLKEPVKKVNKLGDTKGLSPKAPKALKTPTPMSKVEDALPGKTKMDSIDEAMVKMETPEWRMKYLKEKIPIEEKKYIDFTEGKGGVPLVDGKPLPGSIEKQRKRVFDMRKELADLEGQADTALLGKEKMKKYQNLDEFFKGENIDINKLKSSQITEYRKEFYKDKLKVNLPGMNKKLPYSLSIEEGKAISDFTNNSSSDLEVIRKVDSAIKKLPNYKGKIYRTEIKKKDLSVGDSISFDTIKSGTKEKTIADNISNTFGDRNKVIYEIDTKGGKDISLFSNVSDEAEVVIPKGNYKVISKETKNGIDYIKLQSTK